MSEKIYNKNTGYHNRRSIRLKGYDYSQPGYYFVTVCIHDRKQFLFGNIIKNKMVLNQFGNIVKNEILKTEQMRPNVKINDHIVMPDHCHIIYQICETRSSGSLYGHVATCPNVAPTQRASTKIQIERFGKPTSNSIPTIVRLTKSTIKKQINILRNTPGKEVWQGNYYEHIIRDARSLFYIKRYIQENPLHWHTAIDNHIYSEINHFEMTEIEEL